LLKNYFPVVCHKLWLCIKSNYGGIATTISRLEAVGTDLHESLELIKGVKCEIGRARGKIGDAVKSKLNAVLRRNNCYVTICKISDILSGNEAILGVDEPASNSNDLTLFRYALVTSWDVERSSPCYKTILSDNRRIFSLEALKMHIIIYCNGAKKPK
jgi:hypothetical protein